MKMKKYAKYCAAYTVFWLRYFEITKQILNKWIIELVQV